MAKQLKQYAEFYNLDTLIAAKLPPPLEDEHVTIMRLKVKLKCTYSTAERYLEQWTQEGSMEYLGERMNNGHKVKAWRIVSEK